MSEATTQQSTKRRQSAGKERFEDATVEVHRVRKRKMKMKMELMARKQRCNDAD
jgi:hypothetical protein